MDERWEKALAWHRALEMGRRKVEYNATIGQILERLQDVTTLKELQRRYDGDLDWAEAIAREGFPDTPALWARERTTDVAFGRRALQLSGQAGDPTPP